MVWDGAGFHTAKALQVPPNTTVVQLRPYSPELNPIENLWHYLKSHFLEQPGICRLPRTRRSRDASLEESCPG